MGRTRWIGIGGALAVAGLLVALAATAPAEETPAIRVPEATPAEVPAATPDGFTSLFNGKDLQGWTVKCKPADKDRNFWTFFAGSIQANSLGAKGHDYVWLTTNKEYGDFVLRLRLQAFRDSPGNSGIQVRSRYDDAAGWLNGPQIDINPPGPWRTGMMWDETRGNQRWVFPDIPAGKWVNEAMAAKGLKFVFSNETPAWNDLEVIALGTKIKAVLNGVTITDYDGAGVLDDAVHKQRNVGLCGVIALQIHTGDQLRIRFKDLFIKELGK